MYLFKKKSKRTVTPLVVTDTNDRIILNENGSQTISTYSSIPTTNSVIISRKKTCYQQCCTKENLKEQALLLATIISVVLGIAVGISLRGLKCPKSKIKTKDIFIILLCCLYY